MIIEIPLGKSRYKITCEESQKEHLFHLAEKLNQRINGLALSLKNADEKTLLAVTALTLEEEIDQDGCSENNHDDNEAEKLNDQDMYDAVSESMENIADYIEKLITKIQNY